ncbi:hypothetical protein [Acuticoccus sediminis]|uniref:hypothetical protein n=1 Tax=Acuticoccus sediminis TaxID=2184697 RepID=UPI001CFD2C2B|nr:hypothetical protein [Acuticoccus sediminis]
MRLLLRAAAIAGAAMVAAATTGAAAFDLEACNTVRAEANNVRLADLLLGVATDSELACYVRIALLRLGRMGEDDYGNDARARGAYRIDVSPFNTEAGPYPMAYLASLAAELRASPSEMHDQVFARAFVMRMGKADEPAALDPASPFAPPAPGAEAAAETAPESAAGAAGEAAPQGSAAAAAEKGDLRTPPVASIAGVGPADADAGSAGPDAAAVPPELRRSLADAGFFPEGATPDLSPINLPRPNPVAPDVRAALKAAAASAAPGAAAVATPSGCDDAGSDADPDVRRNRGAIARAGLCVGRVRLTEGAITWTFVSVENRNHPDGPVWYLPHDNEAEAFDAAVYAVARYGGRMVAVAGDETRFYRGIDPNRYFATTDADARPCRIRRATPTYTAFVMGLFVGRPHIFSAHNNTNGGGITARVWTDKEKGYPISSGRFGDPDDLIYIAGPRPIADDRDATAIRQKLNEAGLSVVHEHVTRKNSDCSFSNHVVLNDGRPYFNVEAEHGSTVQREMVDRLLETLGYSPVAGG